MSAHPDIQTSKHHVQGSTVLLLLQVFWLIFFFETSYAFLLIIAMGANLNQQYIFGSLVFFWAIHTIKFLFEAILLLRLVGENMASQTYITETKLIVYSGIFSQTEKVYDLTKLRTIEVRETWIGRNLGYGMLHLIIASSGLAEEVWLPGIADPRKYERLIQELVPPYDDSPHEKGSPPAEK